MTTKDQERKALEQIRNIVTGLGEGSYIAAAFEGCWEVAEDNIGNDFACNAMDRAAQAARADMMKMLNEERKEAKKAADKAADQIEFLNTQLDDSKKMWQERVQEETHKTAEWVKVTNERQNTINDLTVEVANLQGVIDEKDLEIMKLKAQLYDFMIAQNA